MDTDLVLRWMSETGSGSARDLRERLAWLARTHDEHVSRAASGRWLRDVSALGHIEIDWDNDRWSVAPPVITRLPAADGTAVLAGARRSSVTQELEAAEVSVLHHRQSSAAGHLAPPSAVFLQYDDVEGLRVAAAEADATYAGCAAVNIAGRLPPLSLGKPAAPPAAANKTLERLVEGDGAVRFIRSIATSDGLYRLTVSGRPTHLYRRQGDWYHCDLATGVFTEHTRRGRAVLRWRAQRDSCYGGIGVLFADWGAPLPALHSRALTLCSGLTPRFGGAARTAMYGNVPELVASAVAGSLSQSLQHT